MKLFLLVFLICELMSIAGRLIWLAKGEFPERTARSTVGDLAFALVFILWGAALLSR